MSDGTLGYAIIGSIAAAARNIYLDFEVAFPIGRKRDIAWAVSPRFADLREELDAFLARLQGDGTLARLVDRYIPGPAPAPADRRGRAAGARATLLPQYRGLFHDAQEKTGIEWRLLAAIAYQESQWDPSATSETGVRGFMQITEDTARRLGINDLLDPAQNVLGAARYLHDLKEKLPPRILEPERTWLALAAFNIGLGHLEDARILAQRQKLDPDLWTDVRKCCRCSRFPSTTSRRSSDTRAAACRSPSSIACAGYYEVLLAHEPPHQPRLRPSPTRRSD